MITNTGIRFYTIGNPQTTSLVIQLLGVYRTTLFPFFHFNSGSQVLTIAVVKSNNLVIQLFNVHNHTLDVRGMHTTVKHTRSVHVIKGKERN